MDPSLYTLIGALGGVVVTQVANFLLEGRKGANQLSLKKLEVGEKHRHELLKERRAAYATYLESFDRHIGNPSIGLESIVSPYYAALILASETTTGLLNSSFQAIQNGEFENVMAHKKELYAAMQADIGI